MIPRTHFSNKRAALAIAPDLVCRRAIKGSRFHSALDRAAYQVWDGDAPVSPPARSAADAWIAARIFVSNKGI
jgi:hypothetical protein